ncbi:NAD(P)-binding protein [Diaporthe sp. PMI_573]|nr:NAD(P)-binding protein [Diaporthaceae sp. PMI_573]
MSSPAQTILFLGATGGSGFAALRRSIAAGHSCVALCRTPSRLTDKLPKSQRNAPNLRIEQGNVVDRDALARCLVRPGSPASLVDAVVFTIGAAFSFSNMSIDQPHPAPLVPPTIVAVSTTGMSEHGRDYPTSLWPFYGLMLKQPHKDKTAMEALMVASGEPFTVVRASLLTNGNESNKPIRVGVEDPKAHKLESKEVGYTISREDVGKWIFDSLLAGDGRRWRDKVVSITY